MNSKFVADFIVECASNGIVSAEEICKEADIQIKQLNEEIGKIQTLKIKRSNLQNVMRQLGTAKPKEKQKAVDFTMSEESLSKEMKKMCSNICDFIDQNPGKTAPEIIESAASYLEQELVYLSIKWLAYHGIVKQISNGYIRTIHKGENWENRPVFLNENN